MLGSLHTTLRPARCQLDEALKSCRWLPTRSAAWVARVTGNWVAWLAPHFAFIQRHLKQLHPGVLFYCNLLTDTYFATATATATAMVTTFTAKSKSESWLPAVRSRQQQEGIGIGIGTVTGTGTGTWSWSRSCRTSLLSDWVSRKHWVWAEGEGRGGMPQKHQSRNNLRQGTETITFKWF